MLNPFKRPWLGQQLADDKARRKAIDDWYETHTTPAPREPSKPSLTPQRQPSANGASLGCAQIVTVILGTLAVIVAIGFLLHVGWNLASH